MSVPVFPKKYPSEPVLTAADLLAFRRSKGLLKDFTPPLGVLLCLQFEPIENSLRKHKPRQVKGFLGDCYLLAQSRSHRPEGPDRYQIGVTARFGIGAPAAVAALEEFVAAGVRQFIAIGVAGSLQPSLRAGDLVICQQAVRDEGTSYHYLPGDQPATASTEITARLQNALDAVGQPYTLGSSWTTDAPYRETRAEIEYYQNQGVLTVELEAAALLAAGQALGVQVGAAFCVADALSEPKPDLSFDPRSTHCGLNFLFDAAIEAIHESSHPH